MSIISVSIALIILGVILVVGGISFHFGHFRGPIVFWTTFTSGIYGFVPLGLCLILTGIGMQLPSPDLKNFFLILALSCGMIGVMLGLTMPQFLTPWWFRYLREEYEDQYIFHTLMKEAAKDYSEWKKRTSTMGGLVSWTKEIDEQG
ncbi:MAG: hypothetical protein GY805_37295 [Chloroflexi bacterium]|nr:hypothetical protein [Chloroflexota bacterium]